jgi:hypothetical protein
MFMTSARTETGISQACLKNSCASNMEHEGAFARRQSIYAPVGFGTLFGAAFSNNPFEALASASLGIIILSAAIGIAAGLRSGLECYVRQAIVGKIRRQTSHHPAEN